MTELKAMNNQQGFCRQAKGKVPEEWAARMLKERLADVGLDSGQKTAPEAFRNRVNRLEDQRMNDAYGRALEESAEEQAFEDEVDEALADIYEALQQEAYEQKYAEAYTPAYKRAIADSNDIATAKDIAHDEAHTLATDTADKIARDRLGDAAQDELRDICKRHVSAWLASEGRE